MYRIYNKKNINKIVLFSSDLISVAKFIIPHLNRDIDQYIITENNRVIQLTEIRKQILMRERQRKVSTYKEQIDHLNTKIDGIDTQRAEEKKKILKVEAERLASQELDIDNLLSS